MDALRDWIIQQIQSDFSAYNDDITEIANILTVSKSTNEIWNMVGQGLQSVLISFAISLALAYFFIGLMNLVLMFETLKKEMIMGSLIKFVLCKVAIQNSSYLMGLVFSISNKLLLNISGSSGFQFQVGDGLKDSLPTTLFALLGDLPSITFIRFILWIVMLLITAIAYGRLIQIYLYTIFSAIPMSALGSDQFNATTKNFFLDYGSICLSGAVILIAFKIVGSILSAKALTDLSLSGSTMTVIMFIILLSVMFKAKDWSNKLLGVV